MIRSIPPTPNDESIDPLLLKRTSTNPDPACVPATTNLPLLSITESTAVNAVCTVFCATPPVPKFEFSDPGRTGAGVTVTTGVLVVPPVSPLAVAGSFGVPLRKYDAGRAVT